MSREEYSAALEAHDPLLLEAGEYRWMGDDYQFVWFPRQESTTPGVVLDCTSESGDEADLAASRSG